jgi:hypothetical protein
MDYHHLNNYYENLKKGKFFDYRDNSHLSYYDINKIKTRTLIGIVINSVLLIYSLISVILACISILPINDLNYDVNCAILFPINNKNAYIIFNYLFICDLIFNILYLICMLWTWFYIHKNISLSVVLYPKALKNYYKLTVIFFHNAYIICVKMILTGILGLILLNIFYPNLVMCYDANNIINNIFVVNAVNIFCYSFIVFGFNFLICKCVLTII